MDTNTLTDFVSKDTCDHEQTERGRDSWVSRNQETAARKAASTAVQNWSANMDLTNMKNEFIKDLMAKKNI